MGLCYTCLLHKKRRHMVTRFKMAELRLSLDSKATFALQSLPRGAAAISSGGPTQGGGG